MAQLLKISSIALAFLLSYCNCLFAQKFVLDKDGSIVRWVGFKKASSHEGTIALAHGELIMSENEIKHGNFLIDMNSVEVESLMPDFFKKKLITSLKSYVFFDADRYPTSTFEFTESDIKDGKHLIKGLLKIRGKSHPIILVTTIARDASHYIFEFESRLNRHNWGIGDSNEILPVSALISDFFEIKGKIKVMSEE